MKAETKHIKDPDTNNSIENLANIVNGGLSSDNFKFETISGTTSSAADTKKLFSHKLKIKPLFWFQSIGNVYVKQLTDTIVDIRSANNSENFTIILVP